MTKNCDCGKRIHPKTDMCCDCMWKFIEENELGAEKISPLLKRNLTPLLTGKKWCIDCGKPIIKLAIRCLQCAGIARRGMKYDVKPKLPKLSPECFYEISGGMIITWVKVNFDNITPLTRSPSQPELNLMTALGKLGVKFIPQYRIENYPYDIYLPDYKLLIEYDGWFWHRSDWAIEKGSPERDAIKDRLADREGFKLVRLKGLPERDLTYDEIYCKVTSILRLF